MVGTFQPGGWNVVSLEEFDLDQFSAAHFADSVESRRKAEDLSAVLYPNDATYEGKELRLRQQRPGERTGGSWG